MVYCIARNDDNSDTDKVGKYEIIEKGWFTVFPGMMITQTQTRWVNMRSEKKGGLLYCQE